MRKYGCGGQARGLKLRAESGMKKLEFGKWVREDGGRWRTVKNRTLRGEVCVARFG